MFDCVARSIPVSRIIVSRSGAREVIQRRFVEYGPGNIDTERGWMPGWDCHYEAGCTARFARAVTEHRPS
jgi:hypothetical protein